MIAGVSQTDPRGRADARRRHLLDTARALFATRGFHQTGVAQIASASGIKVGQIYRDFASKEAIIAAICEADLIGWLDEAMLAQAVASGDRETIRQWVRRFTSADKPSDKCQLMAEITAEAGRNEHVAAIRRDIDARVRASLATALAALSRDFDATPMVDFILAVGAGLMGRKMVEPDVPLDPLSRYATALIERELDRLGG